MPGQAPNGDELLLLAEPVARANSFVGTEEYLAPEVRLAFVTLLLHRYLDLWLTTCLHLSPSSFVGTKEHLAPDVRS
jgi:hypothetical protein